MKTTAKVHHDLRLIFLIKLAIHNYALRDEESD